MEYNLILGMDLLSTYHARVDSHQKRIAFKLEGAPKFIFEGIKDKPNIPIISTIQATKLLKHGCQEFLAAVVDEEN